MSAVSLLAFYCGLILLASLVGGWLPIFVRLTHRGMELAISFVAGVILGVGLLHLLPHAFAELGSIDQTMCWVLIGFLLMFFIQRFFHFHHHGPPVLEGEADLETDSASGAADPHDHTHCQHVGHHDHPHAGAKGQFSWIAAAIGLTLHGIVEGVALAAAVTAEQLEMPGAAWAGLSTFLAIVLHKPFDSLTILTLMSAGDATHLRRHLMNLFYAAVVPLGVAAYLLAAARFTGEPSAFLGRSLAFAAGTFLCIATSDLLPELQFHSHDRLKLSAALLAGLGLAWLLGYFEANAHGHSHSDPPHVGAEADHDHSHHDEHEDNAHDHDHAPH